VLSLRFLLCLLCIALTTRTERPARSAVSSTAAHEHFITAGSPVGILADAQASTADLVLRAGGSCTL